MAYEIPGQRITLIAAADMSAKRFYAISVDSAGKAAIVGANERIAGIIQDAPKADQAGAVVINGVSLAVYGGTVTAGADLITDSAGRLVAATGGAGEVIVATALTGGAVDEIGTVLLNQANTLTGSAVITYQVEDLDAGADIADRPIFVVPTSKAFTVADVHIISQGDAAGIDATNTCVVALENGVDVIVSKTYNNVVTFPAAGAADDLGTITNPVMVAGDILTLSVTNGTTANPPAFILQVIGTYANA